MAVKKLLPTLQKQRHPLASPASQRRLLADLPLCPFAEAVAKPEPLRARRVEVLQINVGKRCNQTCRHCHVDAGPDHPEVMCNLTITQLPNYADLPEFLATHRVEVIASLPAYAPSRTDAQRGEGVFEQSILALRRFNTLGYGKPGTALVLHLVTNPVGAFLPGNQASLERDRPGSVPLAMALERSQGTNTYRTVAPVLDVNAGRGSVMWWMSYVVGLLLIVGVIGLSATGAAELTFTVQRPEQVQTFTSSGEAQLALLAQTPGMNIRVNKLTGRIKRHTHPQSHHFLYLIQGQIELTVGEETRRIQAGDFVIIPQGSVHAMQRVGADEALFLDIASPPDVGDVIWHE